MASGPGWGLLAEDAPPGKPAVVVWGFPPNSPSEQTAGPQKGPSQGAAPGAGPRAPGASREK